MESSAGCQGSWCHLDFTLRARAGTLSNRVREAAFWVPSVGALPLRFQAELGLVRGKYLPVGLHAAEASYVSSSSISFSHYLVSVSNDAEVSCLLS